MQRLNWFYLTTPLMLAAFWGCALDEMGSGVPRETISTGAGVSTSSSSNGGEGGFIGISSSASGVTSSSSSSSSGATGPSMLCGASVCTGGNICCTTPKGALVQYCALPDDCSELDVTCDGVEDCPTGMYCCGTFDFTPGYYNYSQVVCSSCTEQADYVICRLDDANADCPPGKTCTAELRLGPGYGYCN